MIEELETLRRAFIPGSKFGIAVTGSHAYLTVEWQEGDQEMAITRVAENVGVFANMCGPVISQVHGKMVEEQAILAGRFVAESEHAD